jgi:hypothetical protein
VSHFYWYVIEPFTSTYKNVQRRENLYCSVVKSVKKKLKLSKTKRSLVSFSAWEREKKSIALTSLKNSNLKYPYDEVLQITICPGTSVQFPK